jgi:thiamine kinase-like enzyme
MNKILQLFDEKYVKDMLSRKVLPFYADFKKIDKIKIHAYKKNIWEHTYHVVIEFNTTFLTKDGRKKRLPIVCSAHSSEPRQNVYESLKFLWESGFSRGYLSIPHPLFYSAYFNGTFYRGVEGRNFYQYIREQKLIEVSDLVEKSAKWFAKLHAIKNAKNFNIENSRIETVFPGVAHIVNRIKTDYPEYEDFYARIYEILDGREKNFLSSTDKRWLVHGDAHPENIIKMGKHKIAAIDFTDLCLTDFSRDLGAFLQQLEYMCNRKIGDKEYVGKVKKLFLDNYFKHAKGVEQSADINDRIETYYNWTAMRTASHFLLKSEPEPDRARLILEQVSDKFNIKLC